MDGTHDFFLGKSGPCEIAVDPNGAAKLLQNLAPPAGIGPRNKPGDFVTALGDRNRFARLPDPLHQGEAFRLEFRSGQSGHKYHSNDYMRFVNEFAGWPVCDGFLSGGFQTSDTIQEVGGSQPSSSILR